MELLLDMGEGKAGQAGTHQPYERHQQGPHKGGKDPVGQVGQHGPRAHHTGEEALEQGQGAR